MSGVIGEPLLPQRQLFEIILDASDHLSLAAANRPAVRGIAFRNTGWQGSSDEVIVSISAELPAGGRFLLPYRKAYPAPGVGDVIRDGFLNVEADLKQMVALEEAESGTIIAQVWDEEELLAEHRQRIDVLAYNQWLHAPGDYDSLAAFVFPRHPVVMDIMAQVRERLERDTGSGSTEGYYGGPRRVFEITKAIFEELQALNLEYSAPPPSFEGYGQKIRTPDVVLREGVATCLDSTVLSASCIAAAGLSPLLFLTDGHAFPGAWVTPANAVGDRGPTRDPLRPSVVDNPNHWDLVSPLVTSFESTKICSRQETFEDAIDTHRDFSDGSKRSEFEALIDVARASETGIRRLPSRMKSSESDDYEVEIDRSFIEPITPEATELEIGSDDAEDRERLSDGDVPRRVRRWMDALLSIENSNPLVNLRSSTVFPPPPKGARRVPSIRVPTATGFLAAIEDRLMSGQGLKAVCTHRLPQQLLTSPTDEALVEHIAMRGEIALAPVVDMNKRLDSLRRLFQENGRPPQLATAEAMNEFERSHEQEAARRFKALKKLADATEAESATNQLFLTIGTMVWESPAEGNRAAKEVRSPMFIIPIRLSGTAQTSIRITMDEGGEISPNYCLVEKLRIELGLRLRELESPNLDDAGIDVDHMISTIRSQLSKSKFASIRIEEECNLAVLDFATFRMWKDIRANWRLFAKNKVVDHLINGAAATLEEETESFTGEPLTPFACDESQLDAVRWALEGRSFVLEGPPGTGKSQTIANIMAASMAEGMRVLFVAEKAVALNSVEDKLREIGLDPFCITMHHESTTPDSIRRQLQASLDFAGEDASAQWASESAVVTALQQRLSEYRDAIVDTNHLGLTALSSAQEVVRVGDGTAIDVDPQTLGSLGPALESIRSTLLQARSVAGASRLTPRPEWALSTIATVESLDRTELSNSVSELEQVVPECVGLRPLIEPLMDSGERVSESIVKVAEVFRSGSALEDQSATEVLSANWAEQVESIDRRVSELRASHESVFGFFRDDVFGLDLTPQMTAASEAMSAGLLSRRRKADALRTLVTPIARATVTQEPGEILALLQLVAPVREAIAQIRQSVHAISNLEVRADFSPLNPDHLLELSAQAAGVRRRAELSVGPEAELIRSLVAHGADVSPAGLLTARRLLDAWSVLREVLGVTAESMAAWRSDRSTWDALADSLSAWCDDSEGWQLLTAQIRVCEHLRPLLDGGQVVLYQSILDGTTELDNVYEQFERGLARASLHERLAHGALSTFDRAGFDKAVADYTRHDADRRFLMRTVIPRQLSEARPFKPGVRTGAIGALERELGKKLRRVSMAKLMQQHGEMITRLAPCFLMSPEAVSRLLPADSQFFDIVVFDEASQIRVAAAIPAMGRSKSAIIVGDSKQMPPSKRIGHRDGSGQADDADEEVFEDLESILAECSESNLQSLMLQCHYRSEHEGLIAFSNRNFYDGKLVTFPAPNTARTSPVVWVDVPDGQWHRQGELKGTNPAEADAVVDEIVRRVNDPEHAGKSIGVVTFNERQAALIGDRLDALKSNHPALAAALNHPIWKKRLFVVPLEKVQGDERDTIMLSVSYSYQEDRTKVKSRWGPLTNAGGERRLNVAITRAKKDLLIFCSFDPDHVDTKSSTHLGVPATVEFLKECRDAAQTKGAALRAREVSSIDRFRRKLLRRLIEQGVRATEDVGLSRFRIDIAVSSAHDDQFLALLLDGDGWASRKTAYDREILPVSVLRRIGWRRTGRVWLRSAVDDTEQIVATVQNELLREDRRLELKQALGHAGFEVRDDFELSEIGLDLAIRRPGQTMWPLAISLNGPGLFTQFERYEGDKPREDQARAAACVDSFSLWLPDLSMDLDLALSRIEEALQRAEQRAWHEGIDVSGSETTEAVETSDEDSSLKSLQTNPAAPNESVLLGSENWTEFRDARSLSPLGGQEVLGPGPGFAPQLLRRCIDEVVDFEAPIVEKRLASIVAGRFGMSRVRSSRLNALVAQFAHLRTSSSPRGVVYWPSDLDPATWNSFRTCIGDVARPIDEVPAEELANAMVEVVRAGGSATSDEIVRLVAQAFGRKSVTSQLREQLETVLDWASQRGALSFAGDYFRMPDEP